MSTYPGEELNLMAVAIEEDIVLHGLMQARREEVARRWAGALRRASAAFDEDMRGIGLLATITRDMVAFVEGRMSREDLTESYENAKAYIKGFDAGTHCTNPECGVCHKCQMPHKTSEHGKE